MKYVSYLFYNFAYFAQAVGSLAGKCCSLATWHQCVTPGPSHGVSAHQKLGCSLFQWGQPRKLSLEGGKLAKIPSGKHAHAHVPSVSPSPSLMPCVPLLGLEGTLIKASCEISKGTKKKKKVIPYSKCAVVVLGSLFLSPQAVFTMRQKSERSKC